MTDVVSVVDVTTGAAFTAGVLVLADDRLVLTLNRDHLPSGLGGGAWLRVGGVGGGQEPGETIAECALREAEEELGTPVELVGSSVTYRADSDGLTRLRATDALAPLLFAHTVRSDPRPFAPGLPSGHDLYSAIYLGRMRHGPRPCQDEVAGLLLLPRDLWTLLEGNPRVDEAIEAGAAIVEAEPLAGDARLWVHPEELWRLLVELLERHPEVQSVVA
ncbi:MAG: NUDIX domain-containing protein [Actinomycetota bacterium]|nr:NUDIX domain-containing protein [Actinomycetota bacterium]